MRATMGLEKIGYIVGFAVAGIGLLGFAYSMVAKRRQLMRTVFAVLVVGLAGVLFWRVFTAGLKSTVGEAIAEGLATKQNVLADVTSARALHQPVPKPDENDLLKIRAMEHATQTARLFGWEELVKELQGQYLPSVIQAKVPNR